MKQSKEATMWQQNIAVAGLASVLAAGMVMTGSSAAHASRAVPEAGAASAASTVWDVEALVLARKIAAAQDRVDRPWLNG